jgi:hypothetical protein
MIRGVTAGIVADGLPWGATGATPQVCGVRVWVLAIPYAGHVERGSIRPMVVRGLTGIFRRVTRARVSAGTLASVVILVAACANEENDCPADLESLRARGVPDARVVIGSGKDQFEELREGHKLMIIHGIQGGYHVLLNARIYGMNPGRSNDYTSGPMTRFAVVDEEGTTLTYFPCPIYHPYLATSEDGFELARAQSLLIPNDMVPLLLGTNATARVEVLDRDGRYGTSECPVVLSAEEQEPLTPPEPHTRQP